VGKGSTFYVSLPAADAAAVPAEAEDHPAPATERRGTVLLVEDEATVLRFARTALELNGFRVLVASTAADALAIAASGAEISLLLTDVVMPRMSGPELATELRRARPGLAVLYMSGYPAGLVMQEQLEPTMRLISKPFRVAELVAAVTDLLPPEGKKG
jgi:CheY-like chemotaxis protein